MLRIRPNSPDKVEGVRFGLHYAKLKKGAPSIVMDAALGYNFQKIVC